MTEVVDSTAVEVPSAALEALPALQSPTDMMNHTAEVANALKDFVARQGLVSRISGRDYMQVESWQMLGLILGVTPANVTTTKVEDGWESRVELHDRDGRVVGAGEAECLTSEKMWGKRDDYARRSMAQTRAIGKAYRNTFGFIAKAAGFEATPAEEMPGEPEAKGPALGPLATEDQEASLERALCFLLDESDPDSFAVQQVFGQIRAEGDGKIRRGAVQAVARTAKALKLLRETPAGDATEAAHAVEAAVGKDTRK